MPSRIEIQTTVKRGLPVLASGSYMSAEPDVGIFGDGIEDLAFSWLSGKPLPDKMQESVSEDDRIRVETELLEAFHQPEEDYA